MANRLAGGTLDETVATLLAEKASYQAISEHLKHRFGIEVTRVTLAKWYPQSDAADIGGAA